jgi:O-Antigen ligase
MSLTVRAALVTGGVALAGATAAALAAGRTVFALLPLGAIVGLLLLGRPALLLGIFVGGVALCEIDPEGFLGFRTFFYDGRPSVSDALFVAVLAATAVDLARTRRRILLPDPFTLPLVFLALAIVGGTATGYVNGGDQVAILNAVRTLAVLVCLPFVVVNVVRERRDVWNFVAGAAALCIVKGIEGMVSWFSAAGRPLGGTTLTFYAPAPNFLLLAFLLVVLGFLALRVRMPWWVYAATPICLAAFVLSFRRNFWIAGVVGVVLLLLSSGFRGRRILIAALAVFVLAARLAVSVTSLPDLESSVAERFSSLTPTRVEADPFDRYRLDESRNVVAVIRGHPITGLGLGVPWEAKYPLPVELERGREYTHVTFLWWWLKLGLLGALAYLMLMITAMVTALALARRHPLVEVRAVGLGLFAALVGLAVAETTGSFTGVSPPLTIIFAALLGWLAAARRELVGEPVLEQQSAELAPGVAVHA